MKDFVKNWVIGLVGLVAFSILFLSVIDFDKAEAATSSTLPLDTGIVIDVSGGESEDINALVTEQGNAQAQESVTTPEGNSLPIDSGVTPPVSNEVDLSAKDTTVETKVKEEPVVLTEKQPVVQPLPKTGLMDNTIFIALGLLLIASVTLIINRKPKEI